jgi:hypothetical protein
MLPTFGRRGGPWTLTSATSLRSYKFVRHRPIKVMDGEDRRYTLQGAHGVSVA